MRLRPPRSTPSYPPFPYTTLFPSISPADFMSAATRYQMLPDLDRAVLKKVFAALTAVREQLSGRRLRFSLNLSGPTIGDPEFLEWVAASIGGDGIPGERSEEHTSELKSLMSISYAGFCLKKK